MSLPSLQPLWVYLFTNSQNDQFPVGSIAQLVEHYIGNTVVIQVGLNPVQA